MVIKQGIRVLAVAESFRRGFDKSILVGVVARGDLIIDGFSYAFATLGGLDATNAIYEIYRDLNRSDINYIMISGCIISWYNIIDLNGLYWMIKRPIISITYEESSGLIKYFKENFPRDWHIRLLKYFKNGNRVKVTLKNGLDIFIRSVGISTREATEVINLYVVEGRYPEPIKTARIIANRLLNKLISDNTPTEYYYILK